MSVLTARRQGQREVSDAGQLEPVEPAQAKPPRPSRIAAHQQVPSEPVNWKAPIVERHQRRNGMRYLYALGAVLQPLSMLGTGPDLGQAVWTSSFQPYLSSLHDAGFNDALFESGYPGFNLGLSFKVPQLPKSGIGSGPAPTGPGYAMRMTSSMRRNLIQKVSRNGQANGSSGN